MTGQEVWSQPVAGQDDDQQAKQDVPERPLDLDSTVVILGRVAKGVDAAAGRLHLDGVPPYEGQGSKVLRGYGG